MYLHLGGEVVIRQEDVLFICDLDNASASHITRSFLRQAEEEGRIYNIAEDLPKSFVVCSNGLVYLSQLNSATLLRRAESFGFE